MRHEKFHYPDLSALNAELTRLNVTLPLSENIGALASPVTVGKLTVRNRLAVQPMEGCDGTPDGKPGELTLRRYDRFTDGGAALIWVEACAVVREGRANPRQLWLHEENVDAFKSLVSRIRERGIQANGFAPVLILQLTHSGRYSKPEGTPAPLIAYNNPLFEKEKPIDPSRILSDDRLDAAPAADHDLRPVWPLGSFYGACCPCPAHRGADGWRARLDSCSDGLRVFRGSDKTGPVSVGDLFYPGERVYVEGCAASSAVLICVMRASTAITSPSAVDTAGTISSQRKLLRSDWRNCPSPNAHQ